MQLVDLNLGAVGLLFKSPWWFWAHTAKFGGWYCQQSEAFTLCLTSAAPLVAQPTSPGTGCWQPQVGVMTGLTGAPECHSLASSSCEGFLCVHSTWKGCVRARSGVAGEICPWSTCETPSHLALLQEAVSWHQLKNSGTMEENPFFSASGVNAHYPVRRGWCKGA